ncbi:MAG: DUF1634 domain-containing protein [Phycisphaerae bacterium]
MTIPPPDMEKVHRVEWLISTILRTGVILSLTLIVLGTVLSFVHHPSYVESTAALARLTAQDAPRSHTLRAVLDGVWQGRGQAIVIAGLLLLIATPIVRVAVSIFAFVYQKDRAFVVITTIVLLLLLLSFFLGKVGG